MSGWHPDGMDIEVVSRLLIKGFAVGHAEGFCVEFAINSVMFAVLGYKQLRVIRQRGVQAVVVERSRGAVGDGEIGVFLYRDVLRLLPDERCVDLALLAERQAVPETLRGFAAVGVLVWGREKVPDEWKGIFHKSKMSKNDSKIILLILPPPYTIRARDRGRSFSL